MEIDIVPNKHSPIKERGIDTEFVLFGNNSCERSCLWEMISGLRHSKLLMPLSYQFCKPAALLRFHTYPCGLTNRQVIL